MTLSEQLTANFYAWEERGRGWQSWDQSVELEPAFEPFFHARWHTEPPVDDGRKPTVFSRIADALHPTKSDSHKEEHGFQVNPQHYVSEPELFQNSSPLQEIRVSLSSEDKIDLSQIDQFLLTVSGTQSPISFEIIGTSDSIIVQFVCREPDTSIVREQLLAYFPGIALEIRENSLVSLLRDALVIDFGLSEEFMRPIRTFKRLEPDPLSGIIAALENLREGEVAIFQVLLQATRRPWTESILRSVGDGEGGLFFEDAPTMLNLAREKTLRPLFASVVRVIAQGETSDRSWDIAAALASPLAQFSEPNSNEFIPLENTDIDPLTQVQDVLLRETHRSGMLLNSLELSGLVHPPSGSIYSQKFVRHFKKTRPLPKSLAGHELTLGENIHRGVTTVATLSARQRLNHMHIIGATGTGKSTLLLNMICQDFVLGHGLAVIDPHGDLIEKIMGSVPRRRINDVILVDPSDPDNTSGINILTAQTEAEKNVAASDLVALFRRMSTSWGDQMSVVLGNAIQAFLESDRGGTLIDLRTFLLEESFRREFLKTVRDNDVRYFWEKQHHILRGGTLGSILTRLDTFLRPKIVRKIVAPKDDLRFDNILDAQKILLVKLSQGLIGEENSTLLGTLFVSKLHQAALGRQSQDAHKRRPFFLYIDEFQNFITPSLAGVLSGTRKYGLGLILAHQELRQIFNQDTGVANSVISNPGTRICFRLGDTDAQKLEEGFAHFTAQDLQNLGLGEAIMRVERSDDDFNLKIPPPRTVNPETAKSRLKRLIELSHTGHRYGALTPDQETMREEIEDIHVVEAPQPEKSDKVRIEEDIYKIRGEPPVHLALSTVLPEVTEEKTLSQHRYLQTLIKRMAEDRGFRAVIEEPTPDGSGRVDVGLERNGEKIACEISVTTDEMQELHNIEKCLAAGYGSVIVCTTEKKRLEKIKLVKVPGKVSWK